ncbi:8492_t:CDS:2 [Racocetra fulgida]|uniref:8492_t:CDS:1 n=1 Tax=Racocetra fulgida TaxID=60492 RepID=A0A9N9H9F5_9GLOM|nr:8492_t:CDS:2 [Racocetra fulgida]
MTKHPFKYIKNLYPRFRGQFKFDISSITKQPMSTSIPYDPEKAALLVIDMQEFFCNDSVNKIIPNVKSVVTTCHEKGIPVIWTQHGHLNSELDGGALARWWKNKDKMIMRGSEKWKFLKELDSIVTVSFNR